MIRFRPSWMTVVFLFGILNAYAQLPEESEESDYYSDMPAVEPVRPADPNADLGKQADAYFNSLSEKELQEAIGNFIGGDQKNPPNKKDSKTAEKPLSPPTLTQRPSTQVPPVLVPPAYREDRFDSESDFTYQPSRSPEPSARPLTHSIANIDLFGDPIGKYSSSARRKAKPHSIITKKVQPKKETPDTDSVRMTQSAPQPPVHAITASPTTPPASALPEGTAVATSSENYSLENLPPHQLHRPSQGFGLNYSGGSTQGSGSALDRPGQRYRSFAIDWEYQPTAIQAGGVLGIGTRFEILPESSATDLGPRRLKDFWVGTQLRYQLRYFREQPILVEFLYSLGARSHSGDRGDSWLLTHGPGLGAWFLLNAIDQSLSRSFYQNVGVSRTYLTAEWRRSYGRNASYRLDEQSLHFGLRFEF